MTKHSLSIASATANAASSTFPIRKSRNRFTRNKSAGRSTWCRRAGTGNGSTSPARSWRNWDKTGADNEQFLRAYTWDGKELKPTLRSRFHRAETWSAASHALRLDKNRRSSHHGRESRTSSCAMNLATQGRIVPLRARC